MKGRRSVEGGTRGSKSVSQMHPKPYILSIMRTHGNRNKNAFLA